MIKLKSYSAKTDQGPYLQVNEDDFTIDLTDNLYLIFDGLGGAGIGDRGVSIAKEEIKKTYTQFSGDPDATMPFFYSPKYLAEGNALINSMHYVHSLLKKENANKEMSNRAAVSVIGASLAENIMTFVASGNCQALLCRQGYMIQLVCPDGLDISHGEEYRSGFNTCPMGALGLFDDLQLQIRELKIVPGDLIIMMTDGVYARISPKELKHMLQKTETPAGERLEEIFKLANKRENKDNQTMVLLQF